MKKDTQKTQQVDSTLQQLLAFATKHALVICVALFAGLVGYILLLTNQLTNAQPDQSSIDAQLSGVARPKIDESVVKTITGLEERNIEIKAIFEDARDNPFNE